MSVLARADELEAARQAFSPPSAAAVDDPAAAKAAFAPAGAPAAFDASAGPAGAPAAPPPDKYQQAAIDERNRVIAAGGKNALPEGYTRRLLQGYGANWTDEAAAALMTPAETIYRGVKEGNWNPADAYRYSRARELLSLEKARENTGVPGSAAEVGGALATGGRAVLGSALPAAGSAAIQQAPGVMNAIGRYAGNVGKAAAIGGVAGVGDAGDTLKERAVGGAIGTAVGAGLGVALPPVVKALGYVAAPLTNQIRRLASRSPTSAVSNVDDVATAQIANTVERSGKTPEAIAREVADANASGQPYVVADAIGTEGQRRLAGIAKTPGGQHRQWIDEDLGQRDLGRGLRVQQSIEGGLGIPRGGTAEEAQRALTQRARADSRPLYEASDAVQPVWTPRMEGFFRDPDFAKALRAGVETERRAALADNRTFNPTDYAITHFNEAGDPILGQVPNMRTIDLMKRGVDTLINKHRNPVTGRVDTNDQSVRELTRLQQAFLREVDSLNPAYAQARAAYAGPAQVRSAVERGQDIPVQGARPEDTLRRFEALPETEKTGTRIGVADRIAQLLMKGTETGPLPAYLRSGKGRQELTGMSLHQGPRQPLPRNPMARAEDPMQFQPDPMLRAIEREAVMRKTYADARGGSQTAENVGDILDSAVPAGVDPVGVIGNAVAGNWLGAAKAVLPAAGRLAKGETEAQREAMTRILMARDPDQIAGIMQRITDLQARRRAAALAQQGALSSGAPSSVPDISDIYGSRRR